MATVSQGPDRKHHSVLSMEWGEPEHCYHSIRFTQLESASVRLMFAFFNAFGSLPLAREGLIIHFAVQCLSAEY